MATLNSSELVELRQEMARQATTVTWSKGQINVALQAVEDQFEADKGRYTGAIETAAPGVFNLAQKKDIVRFWLRQKFGRGVS